MRTPLLCLQLLGEGHAAIVKWLIDHASANIEAHTINGLTALYWSSARGHPEVVSLLLNRGADINRANRSGLSPLMVAANNRHVGVVELLLSHKGINLEVQDEAGRNALWNARITISLILC